MEVIKRKFEVYNQGVKKILFNNLHHLSIALFNYNCALLNQTSMKNIFLLLLFAPCFAQSQNDESEIKRTIESAYVGGIHNGGPLADIRSGFHPSFVMFRFNKNEIISVALEEWITNIEKGRTQANPNADGNKATAEYKQVSVAGNSANVMLDLFRGDKKLFTDHLLLYKFNEGWRIVSKTFYRY